MHLQIITTIAQLFDGEVKLVQVPGTLGSFEILKNHAPIVSTLEAGTIRIVLTDNKEKTFEVKGGIIENSENNIIVLTDD